MNRDPSPGSSTPIQTRPVECRSHPVGEEEREAFQSFELTAASLRLFIFARNPSQQAKREIVLAAPTEKIRGPNVTTAVECAAGASRMEGLTGVVCLSNEGLMHLMAQKRLELSPTPKGLSENAEATLAREIRNVFQSRSPLNSLKELSQVK